MEQNEMFLDNMPESNNIWKEIGGNYETAQQSINELVDNAISNILGKKSDKRKIESNYSPQKIYKKLTLPTV